MKFSGATLVLSKPLEGKKEFLDSYTRQMIKENKELIFVLTDKTPAQKKQELLKNKIFFKNLCFVDCYSQQAGEESKEDENVKNVAGPLALNEVSIALSEFGRDFAKKQAPHSIVFDSLSTLLMYADANAIARFLQILIARIKKFGGDVIFTIEEGMHDPKAIATIEHLMDEIIEVKKETGRILFKSKGFENRDWTELK